MKISELLEREPFGEIVEETMSRHWSETLGKPVAVAWNGPTRGGQVWRGNSLLNFFAVDGARPECFEIIRREFSYTRVAWRRPLQFAYVRAAVRMPWRRWLAQLQLAVSPDIPEADTQVLLGGNRRMRMLKPLAGESVVIEKGGFPSLAMTREIDARLGPAAAISPRLLQVAADRTWFSEEYVAGAPINRLARRDQREQRVAAIEMLDLQVYQGSRETSTIGCRARDELSRVVEAMRKDSSNSLTGEMGRVRTAVEALAAELNRTAGDVSVPVVFSHGDFQDANILECAAGLRVIDWESAARRCAFYDAATLYSGLRLHPEWVVGWEQTCVRWSGGGVAPFPLPTGVEWTPTTRRGLLGLWALEEIAFRIEDAYAAAYDAMSVKLDSVERDVAAVMRVLRNLP